MSNKLDILAPFMPEGGSALIVQRWLKLIGDPVVMNEPITELVGNGAVIYVHAPAEGILSSIQVLAGQNILSGGLLGQVSIVSKSDMDWENFDEVTAILEDFADKSKTSNQKKDANEALGQLLGVSDKDVFRAMSIENQNKFLQNVVDQYKAHGLSPADVAQKLLEGLKLRTPSYAPPTSAPAFGIRGPSGPGMAGGGAVQYTGVTPQQQQGYAPPPQQVPWTPPIPQDE